MMHVRMLVDGRRYLPHMIWMSLSYSIFIRLGVDGSYMSRQDTTPIATLDFNAADVTTEEVGEILDQIRAVDGIIAFEQGHNETYTLARKDE